MSGSISLVKNHMRKTEAMTFWHIMLPAKPQGLDPLSMVVERALIMTDHSTVEVSVSPKDGIS